MAKKETLPKTLIFAALICIVCSVVVSSAAVVLRPMQQANQQLDFRRNILMAAGIMEEGKTEELFAERITVRVVNLKTAEYTDLSQFENLTPENFDQAEARTDPQLSQSLSPDNDPAGIGRRENFANVYLIKEEGEIKRFILPVRGYGLWSTLYGFIALKSDADTIEGIIFYDHGETPGLGGKVDNLSWRAKWDGKKAYNEEGEVAIEVIKGSVSESSPRAEHQVDGLSGATLTSKGVSNLVRYWLGEDGFKPFLENVKAGEV